MVRDPHWCHDNIVHELQPGCLWMPCLYVCMFVCFYTSLKTTRPLDLQRYERTYAKKAPRTAYINDIGPSLWLCLQPGCHCYCLACDWDTAALMTEHTGLIPKSSILFTWSHQNVELLIQNSEIGRDLGVCPKFLWQTRFCFFGRQDVFSEVWMTNWMCSAHQST